MSTREGKAQISLNVPKELYEEYKKVLRSRTPTDNTTRDIIKHMFDTVADYRRQHGEPES